MASAKIKPGDTVRTGDGHTAKVDKVYVATGGDDEGLESAELTLDDGEFRRAFTANLRK